MTSLYDVLQVSSGASPSVIRAAYRCLAQQDHPDKQQDSQDAEQRMAHINRAYAVLSDPRQRQAYDVGQGYASMASERRGRGGGTVAHKVHPSGQGTTRLFAFRPLY